MWREWRSGCAAIVSVVIWTVLVQPTASVCYNVAARIEHPSDVKNCAILKKFAYLVYPVENIPRADDPRWIDRSGGFNNLFSIYGGDTAGTYFANKIIAGDTCMTVARAVLKQLVKSKFQGVEVKCDPTVKGLSQSVYASWLREFRKLLGGGYILAVRIENSQPSSDLAKALNDVVDLINCPNDLIVRGLLSEGCNSRKIVLDVPLPSAPSCPIDYTIVRATATSVKCLNLYGAILTLNCDDLDNRCGEGYSPLLDKLCVLLDNDEICNFKGFMPDPRDNTRFYSCSNGVLNHHQCTKGQVFDCVNKTCMPFVKIFCNETTCTIVGPIHPTVNSTFIPMLIPFPKTNYTPPALASGFNQTEIADLLDYLQKHGFAANVRNINQGIEECEENVKKLKESHDDTKNQLSQGSAAIDKSNDNVSGMTAGLGALSGPIGELTAMLQKLLSMLSPSSGSASPGAPSLPLG